MVCPKCGKESSENDKFCSECGSSLFHRKTNIQKELSLYNNSSNKDRVRHSANPLLVIITYIGGIIFIIFGVLLLVTGESYHGRYSPVANLGAFMITSGIAGTIFGFILQMKYVYRMWSYIQDGTARTTPGKAVAFLFVPLFNFYWIFQVFYGWSVDYNNFRLNHDSNLPEMPVKLFLTDCILTVCSVLPPPITLFILIPKLVLSALVLYKMCYAINSFLKSPASY